MGADDFTGYAYLFVRIGNTVIVFIEYARMISVNCNCEFNILEDHYIDYTILNAIE